MRTEATITTFHQTVEERPETARMVERQHGKRGFLSDIQAVEETAGIRLSTFHIIFWVLKMDVSRGYDSKILKQFLILNSDRSASMINHENNCLHTIEFIPIA